MNVAVLGANGFIGRNLVRVLLKKSFHVTAFDLSLKKDIKGNISWVEGDFFDIKMLEALVKRNDILIHAICTINPGISNKKYMYAYRNDLIQSIELCELCTQYKKKLLFISSGGTVYGTQKYMPIAEETFSYPINHYGNLKLCTENTYRTFFEQQGTDIIIARISNVYGPGQDYSKGVGFIDAVIKRGLEGKIIEVFGNGTIVRDYIYIEDACEMLAELLKYNGKIRTFNISSNLGTSQNDILNIVSAYILKLKISYLDGRDIDAKEIILDNSRIRSIYQGRIRGVQEGIKDYIEYLRK